MVRDCIRISLVNERDCTDWQFGERFLAEMIAFDARLRPSFIGRNPDKLKVLFTEISEAQQYWATPVTATGPGFVAAYADEFAWKSTGIKLVGSLSYPTFKPQVPHERPGLLSIRIYPAFKKFDYFGFFQYVCEFFEAQHGVLHLFSGVEAEHYRFSDPRSKFQSWVYAKVGSSLPHAPDHGVVPQLAWASYWSHGLQELIDKDVVRQCAAELIDTGRGLYIKSTPDLFDVKKDYEAFDRVRKSIKSGFPDKYFKIDQDCPYYE